MRRVSLQLECASNLDASGLLGTGAFGSVAIASERYVCAMAE